MSATGRPVTMARAPADAFPKLGQQRPKLRIGHRFRRRGRNLDQGSVIVEEQSLAAQFRAGVAEAACP